jgi:signal transduction histidine kinase
VKLISKTILYYLLMSLPLLLIAGYLSYTLIRSEVRDGTDESLLKEKAHAEKLINSSMDLCFGTDSLSGIKATASVKTGYAFMDTTVFDKAEQEVVDYRVLRGYYKKGNQNYMITIAKPRLEENELMEGLYSSLLLVIGFLLTAFFLVNWLLSKTLWKPFYRTIENLDAYDLKKMIRPDFGSSSTKEFVQLNKALDKMTEKIRHDFIQQKEFTENASHEMQTPLAVIKSKLELLMQSPHLKESEMNQLQAIEGSVNKLASLNKALLLLAKIENKQFKEVSDVNVEEVVNRVLYHYEDIMQAKNIAFTKIVNWKLNIKINPALCDILITNLIQNAIRHNHQQGSILITIDDSSLTISNTGEPLTIPPAELFERFKKNDASKESLGLGLSIVKSITGYYGYSIGYSYNNNLHNFVLTLTSNL